MQTSQIQTYALRRSKESPRKGGGEMQKGIPVSGSHSEKSVTEVLERVASKRTSSLLKKVQCAIENCFQGSRNRTHVYPKRYIRSGLRVTKSKGSMPFESWDRKRERDREVTNNKRASSPSTSLGSQDWVPFQIHCPVLRVVVKRCFFGHSLAYREIVSTPLFPLFDNFTSWCPTPLGFYRPPKRVFSLGISCDLDLPTVAWGLSLALTRNSKHFTWGL